MTQGSDKKISRRNAILRVGVGVAAPMLIPRGVLGGEGKPGANERIGVGAIGVGFRATLLLDQLPEAGRIVALCDCDLPRAEAFQKKKGQSWDVLQSHQKLLERKDIDAVIVATQEFQRVLPCIHACQAGKDVYAEKPLSLCIHESRVLVNAVRKHRRILQVGSQQRSMEVNRVACDFIRSGGLGKSPKCGASTIPARCRCRKSRSPKSPSRRASIGTCGSIRRPGGSTTASGAACGRT